MLPFILVPAVITNSEGVTKETEIRVQPQSIEYYYPGFYNGTVVVLKSGQSFLSTLDTDTLDQALEQYERLSAKDKRFGIIELKYSKN